jgi:hypothetical protein
VALLIFLDLERELDSSTVKGSVRPANNKRKTFERKVGDGETGRMLERRAIYA